MKQPTRWALHAHLPASPACRVLARGSSSVYYWLTGELYPNSAVSIELWFEHRKNLTRLRSSFKVLSLSLLGPIFQKNSSLNLCKRHLAVLPRTVHLCLQHQSFDLPQMFLAGVCAKGHERYVRKAMGSMLERRWVASSKKIATPIFKKFHNINNDLLRAQICAIRLWSEF